MKGSAARRWLWLVLAVCVASAVFLAQARWDNKYRMAGPRGENGLLDWRAAAQPLTMLTHGWEVWPDELLAPQELTGRAPALTAYLGQYKGFEFGNPARSPHGCATYRLRILLPEEPTSYRLEVPEIYSAARIWVNGQLLWQSGEVDLASYRPSVRTGSVMFTAGGQAEVVVQAADRSHYYSGMVYPPAFGEPKAVARLLSLRLLLRCALCLSAFGVGLLHLLIGLRLRETRRQTVTFSLLSLCFAGYACYPLLHLFGAGPWAYRLEDVCFYAMLFFVALLQQQLCGLGGGLGRVLPGVCAGVCALSALAPLLMRDSLAAMLLYARLLEWYQLVLFGWLIATGLLSARRAEPLAWPLLAGLCVFATALLFHVALPLFEPIVLGWQTELAGCFFVLLLSGVLWRRTVQVHTERAVLAERVDLMAGQLALQEQNYRMVTEHFEEVRRMRHDLRHHLGALGEYAARDDLAGLRDYLAGMGEQADALLEQPLCENAAANALLRHALRRAREDGTEMRAAVALPAETPLENWELGLLLGNLLENALEASRRLEPAQRRIEVVARMDGGALVLAVRNRFDGACVQVEGRYRSSKRDGFGVGLESVARLIERHGGEFSAGPQGGEFEASAVVWPQRQE